MRRDHAADAAETIDTDLDSHNSFLLYPPPGAVFLFRLYYTKWVRFMSPILCKMVHKIPGELFVTFEHPNKKSKIFAKYSIHLKPFLTSFSKKRGRRRTHGEPPKGVQVLPYAAGRLWIMLQIFHGGVDKVPHSCAWPGWFSPSVPPGSSPGGRPPCWITSGSTRRQTLSLYFLQALDLHVLAALAGAHQSRGPDEAGELVGGNRTFSIRWVGSTSADAIAMAAHGADQIIAAAASRRSRRFLTVLPGHCSKSISCSRPTVAQKSASSP